MSTATAALTDPDDPAAETNFAAAMSAPIVIQARIAAFNERAIPAAEEALKAARDRVDQVERMQAYVQADEARAVAEKRLAAEYPEIANRLVALLEAVAEAQCQVLAANRRLPDGVPPLADPEGAVRDRAGVGKRKIREHLDWRWAWEGSGVPLSADQARLVQGGARNARFYGAQSARQGVPVVKQEGMTVEYAAPVSPARGGRLAAMKIPALRGGEPDYWPGEERFDPALVCERLRASSSRSPVPPATSIEFEALPAGHAMQPERATAA